VLTSGQKWRIGRHQSHYFLCDMGRGPFGSAKQDGCGIALGDRLAVPAQALEIGPDRVRGHRPHCTISPTPAFAERQLRAL
jgi:hypothetical protein